MKKSRRTPFELFMNGLVMRYVGWGGSQRKLAIPALRPGVILQLDQKVH